jgi:hypothetical protein
MGVVVHVGCSGSDYSMRMLKLAVVAMGVLIVAGTTVLVVVIAGRISAPAGPPMRAVLDEPAGTHIVAVSALPDRLALQLQGGGPDRVVVLDMHSGREVGRAALAR